MDKKSTKGTRFFIESELENPLLGIYPVLDTDLARDNLENGASDFRDL